MNTVEQKTYTLDEADALLPKLIPMLTKARELKRAIESIAAGCDYEVEKLAKRKPDINNRMRDLQLLIEQIEDLGAYLKDLDIGLCDFLSTYEDRDIMLCWKLGEPHIAECVSRRWQPGVQIKRALASIRK